MFDRFFPVGPTLRFLPLLMLLAGCGPRESAPLTFSVGGAPAETAFWEKLAAEFGQSSGTAVAILRQPTDSDQRRQGLVIPLRARKADPDLDAFAKLLDQLV